MKKLLTSVLSVILCFALAAVHIPYASAAGGFYSTAELLEIKSHIESDAGMGTYATVQGACTDGYSAYFAVQNGSTVIMKYDMRSWELINKATVSGLGHANDMAYNPTKDYIVVANNYSSDDILTVIDPYSLSVIKTVVPREKKTDKEIKKEAEKNDVDIDDVDKYKRIKVYSIAYNAYRGCYVAGISGTYNYALLDEDFVLIKRFTGVSTGYTRQGCDCDSYYVYFPQSGGDNIVAVYDYDGNYIDRLSLGHSHEVENLFHVGSSFYTTLHYYGNFVHRVGMSDSTRITFTVDYEPNGGTGYMENDNIHYGEDTKLKPCTFEKPGYFFGGWMVKRDSDYKRRGYKLGSAKGSWLGDDLYDYELLEDGATVSKTVKFGKVILDAFWINERYTVEFDSGDGDGYMAPLVVGYDEKLSLPKNEFIKSGYVFSGYKAARSADGRVYGYREGSDTPQWLEPDDAAALYLFNEGEEVSGLTYDGAVTLTAQFSYAFVFDDSGRVLERYIGVDEKVVIPDQDGRLNTVKSGAFDKRDNMTELYVPSSVDYIGSRAVVDCSALTAVYFDEELPRDMANDAVEDSGTPIVYMIRDGVKLSLGFYADRHNAALIKNNYSAFERGFAEYLKENNSL